MPIITVDTHTFANNDIVALQIEDGVYDFTPLWERLHTPGKRSAPVRVVYYSLFFGEKVPDTDEIGCVTGGFNVHQTEYFHLLDYSTALKAFKQRVESNQANKATNLGKSLEQIYALGMCGNVKENTEGK